jgi:serine protease Do
MKMQMHRLQSLLTPAVILSVATFLTGFQSHAAEDTPQVDEGLGQPPRQERCFDSSFESFAPIVQKVAPAVVRIVTSLNLENLPSVAQDTLQRYLSARGFYAASQQPIESGLGSGVIVTDDGYILTSSHVVDRSNKIEVTLQDGREFRAKVVGSDLQSDVAVIKIDAHQLPTLPLADSSQVKVGDLVLAVGHPFGVGQTVTHGIVSATDRAGLGLDDYESFIQTDAPINPGNSGGALVDATGRLIGINTAIISNSGGNMGIGFAVPSDLAHRVMADLVNHGHVVRGYLGIESQDLTPELAHEFKLSAATGVLVGGVAHNGPAEKAGLEIGDVITQFDGNEVHDVRQLRRWVADARPGQLVPLEVVREGSSRPLEVILGAASENALASQTFQNAYEPDPGVLQGVIIGELNTELRQQLKIPREIQGAVVFDLHAYSTAAQAGLRPGDVIQTINRQEISNAAEALRLAETAAHRRTLLRVWSSGGSHFILVK